MDFGRAGVSRLAGQLFKGTNCTGIYQYNQRQDGQDPLAVYVYYRDCIAKACCIIFGIFIVSTCI